MPLWRHPGPGYSGHVLFASCGSDVVPAVETPPELRVSRAEIVRMERAAAAIADCHRQLAAENRNILGEIAPATGAIEAWRHYPAGDAYDPASHAQYFYHAHPPDGRQPREKGHFHTFLRAEGMPAGVAPLVLPEAAVADAAPPPQAAPVHRGSRAEVSHLVAISLDAEGEPIRVFTTNRWVTGETWYRAEDVLAMLDRFTFAASAPAPLCDRWLVAVMALFRPQIAAVLRERDLTVMAWRRRRRASVFEDPRLEITSSLDIDLEAQLAFLDRARRAAARPAAPLLPCIADGWGGSHPD
jgi:hypothetical protein